MAFQFGPSAFVWTRIKPRVKISGSMPHAGADATMFIRLRRARGLGCSDTARGKTEAVCDRAWRPFGPTWKE